MPNAYDALLAQYYGPDDRRQSFFDSLGPLGAGLIAAGAPSTNPAAFSQGISQGLLGMQQTLRQGQSDALQRAAMIAKMNEPMKVGEGESLYDRTGRLIMQAPSKPQTDVGKLLAEVNRLPPGDPNRRLYEQQLAMLGQKDGFRFQQAPDGTLVAAPIPGGPADPRYVGQKAGASAAAEAPFKVVPITAGGAAIPGSVFFGTPGMGAPPAAPRGPGVASAPPGLPTPPPVPGAASQPALPPARGVAPPRYGSAPVAPMPAPNRAPGDEPVLLNPTMPARPAAPSQPAPPQAAGAEEPSMENLGPQASAVEPLPGGGIRLRTDRNWEDTADARKAMYKDATDNYHQLRDLAQTNAQTREMLNVFREASKAFPPGADANVRLQVGRWGAALGLASGDTISRGELMQSVQKSLELNLAQSKMKGQGQITENERKMLEEAISLFKSTGQGGELIMKLYEAKMARDDALLDAHEQSISRNTGVVDPLRVQSKLRGIAGRTFAPALMDEVSTFLKTAKAGSAGGGEPLNAGASRRAPTQAHISRLIQNYQDPQERKFFDEAFGEGAAMRAIEQHNKALRGGVLLVPPGPGNSVSP